MRCSPAGAAADPAAQDDSFAARGDAVQPRPSDADGPRLYRPGSSGADGPRQAAAAHQVADPAVRTHSQERLAHDQIASGGATPSPGRGSYLSRGRQPADLRAHPWRRRSDHRAAVRRRHGALHPQAPVAATTQLRAPGDRGGHPARCSCPGRSPVTPHLRRSRCQPPRKPHILTTNEMRKRTGRGSARVGHNNRNRHVIRPADLNAAEHHQGTGR